MKLSRLRAALLGFVAMTTLIAASFSAGCLPVGPLGLIPGGRLRGVPHRGPEPRWIDFTKDRTLELQVDPESPRSVNVGLIVQGGRLFVPATLRPAEKRWPRAIARDPRVVARIRGTLYPRRAQRVADGRLLAALLDAGREKYDPSYFEADKTWFFELRRPKSP